MTQVDHVSTRVLTHRHSETALSLESIMHPGAQSYTSVCHSSTFSQVLDSTLGVQWGEKRVIIQSVVTYANYYRGSKQVYEASCRVTKRFLTGDI